MMWAILGGILWVIGGFISVGMINHHLGPFKKKDFDSISMFLFWELLLMFASVIGGPFASFFVIGSNLMVPKKYHRWGFKL